MTSVEDAKKQVQFTRLAIQQLACCPQSNRRNVQLGHLARAVTNLENGVKHIDEMVAAGEFTAEQGEEIRAVHARLKKGMESDPNFVSPPNSEPREFLYGTALETPEWDELRYAARDCFHNFAGDSSVLKAIGAK